MRSQPGSRPAEATQPRRAGPLPYLSPPRNWPVRLFRLVLLAIVLLAPVGAVPAAATAPGSWQALNTPPGTISHLAVDSSEPSRLWAVSVSETRRGDDRTLRIAGGQLRQSHALYVSVNSGREWLPAGNNLPYAKITALHFDALTARLYVGLAGGDQDSDRHRGLFYSDDGGTTWEKLRLGPDHRQIRVAGMTRNADGSSLYVAAAETTRYPRNFVYRSDDSGSTWREVLVSPASDVSTDTVLGIVADPSNPTKLFLPSLQGVFYSLDEGETWTGLALARCAPGTKQLITLASRGSPAEMVMACQESAGAVPSSLILSSQDGGRTWRAANRRSLRGTPTSLTATSDATGELLLATDQALYQSFDRGRSWTELREGSVVVGAQRLLAGANLGRTAFAATGHGVYVSDDMGRSWQSSSAGLPANGQLQALSSAGSARPVLYVGQKWSGIEGGLSLSSILRSDDGGRTWQVVGTGPWGDIHDIGVHPLQPGHLFVCSAEGMAISSDAGETWDLQSLEGHPVQAVGFDVEPSNRAYAGTYGGGVYVSSDGGSTWAPTELDNLNVYDLSVGPGGTIYAVGAASPEREGGLYASADGGATWEWLTPPESGLVTDSVRTVCLDPSESSQIFMACEQNGVYRSPDGGQTWQPAEEGLPSNSTIVSLLRTREAILWASCDGCGVFRSDDDGVTWERKNARIGDNLMRDLVEARDGTAEIVATSSTGGLWRWNADEVGLAQPPAPQAVDGRIEIVWPHGGVAVDQADTANIGLRLFYPDSLVPPPCDWMPTVDVWQAVNTEPARRLGRARQRSVEGEPFPFWDFNDVDVSAARDAQTKLYYMIRVRGVKTATSIWAHGEDPRTYFPFQDTPSGVSTDTPRAVEARVEIVWPHDGLGQGQSVAQADWANVTVALFEPGTGRTVPTHWEPSSITLFAALNQSIGKPVASDGQKRLVRRGSITFPVWDFNNIDVRAARSTENRLYLWADVEGVTTYPTIWAHGADARTRFPMEDEPIVTCGASVPRQPGALPPEDADDDRLYVGHAADRLADELSKLSPQIPGVSGGVGRVDAEAATALRSILVPARPGLLWQRRTGGDQDYIVVAEGPGPLAVARLGTRVYFLWPQYDHFWYQWWSSTSATFESLRSPPTFARVVPEPNAWEIGIGGDIVQGRNWAHFELLRRSNGEFDRASMAGGYWEPMWSSPDTNGDGWNGLDGEIRLTGDGLRGIRVLGAPSDDLVDVPRVFVEDGAYVKQRVSALWERRGDAYIRSEVTLLPTPLTTLGQYILALRGGDLEAAAALVTDQDLVEKALSFGWSLPRPAGDELRALGGYDDTEGEPIEFFSSSNGEFRFLVQFERDGADWRIASIERSARG